MNAFPTQTIACAFAQLITVTGLMRVVVCAALIVSASEATAQLPAGDTSANAIVRGCQAFVEGRATDTQLYGLGNFCAGIVLGLASVGQQLSPPEWQSCAPAASNAQQLARVVLDYIGAHPERMREDFKRLTLEAFHDAWPCRSGP
jgi:Ssp1 endopeptidase immunity protein Rap1a